MRDRIRRLGAVAVVAAAVLSSGAAHAVSGHATEGSCLGGAGRYVAVGSLACSITLDAGTVAYGLEVSSPFHAVAHLSITLPDESPAAWFDCSGSYDPISSARTFGCESFVQAPYHETTTSGFGFTGLSLYGRLRELPPGSLLVVEASGDGPITLEVD